MYNVLIVDDHKMVMDGWISMIGNTTDFQAVGHLDRGRDVVKFVKHNQVDLIIMDIVMGDDLRDDGLEATRNVRMQFGDNVKVLIVSMHDEIGHIQEAIEAGADGYVLKTASSDELLLAMRKIMSGEMYHSQKVMEQVARKIRIEGELKHIELTHKEKDILPLICKGWSLRKVADHLGVSQSTVDTHKRNIFIKFDVHKVGELINRARDLGFIRID